MFDFDELEEKEFERHTQEALGRLAREDEDAKLEESSGFNAKLRLPHNDAIGPLVDKERAAAMGDVEANLVTMFSAKSFSSAPVGCRRVGDIVRFERQDGEWALLHPLELTRIAADYQDYWHAMLRGEIPRTHGEAWVACCDLEKVSEEATRADQNISASCSDGDDDLQRLRVYEPDDDRCGSSSVSLQEAESDEEYVAKMLTIVISTSPAEHHCDLETMCLILQGFQVCPALRGCRKLVVFDALPDHEERHVASEEGSLAKSGQHWVPKSNDRLSSRYEAYKAKLQEALRQRHPALSGVELIFMERWGHLVGTVRRALETVATPFVMLHQHDLLLSPSFSTGHARGILGALARREANYVLLNRDVNLAGRSTQYFQAAPHRPDLWRAFVRRHMLRLGGDGSGGSGSETILLPFIGYSDQTHIARTSWVRRRVLPLVGSRMCCMEFVVHELMVLRWLHRPAAWEKTFMLGGMLDGPFIFDLQKNGSCWAAETIAYSPEREEDMYVRPSDRVRHPGRLGLCLSLYTRRLRPIRSSVPPEHSIEFFPDLEAMTNRASMERFVEDGLPADYSAFDTLRRAKQTIEVPNHQMI